MYIYRQDTATNLPKSVYIVEHIENELESLHSNKDKHNNQLLHGSFDDDHHPITATAPPFTSPRNTTPATAGSSKPGSVVKPPHTSGSKLPPPPTGTTTVNTTSNTTAVERESKEGKKTIVVVDPEQREYIMKLKRFRQVLCTASARICVVSVYGVSFKFCI